MRLSRPRSTTTAPSHCHHVSRSLSHPQSGWGMQHWFLGSASCCPRLAVGSVYTPVRRSLHHRWTCMVSTPMTRGYRSQEEPFPVELLSYSPSLSIQRLVQFRMRQTRVPRVAMSRVRLAASGQDRVCPYPRVPRASDCLSLAVHSLQV
jgi:hypothetical protein